MYLINEDSKSIVINDSVCRVDYSCDNLIGSHLRLEEIQNVFFTVLDYPKHLLISVEDDSGFGTSLFTGLDIRKKTDGLFVKFAAVHDDFYWKGRWRLSTLFGVLNDVVNGKSDVKVSNVEVDKGWRGFEVDFLIHDDFVFSDLIRTLSEKLNSFIHDAELLLRGSKWQMDFELNEKIFCNELLFPLFQKMGFFDVRYSHGKREYGKDFTFSEKTIFGGSRYYGVQAKAGNIRGTVNSNIDEILGQINDAFAIRFYEVSVNETRFISVFIIAISGYFTENAKEKIFYKLPPHFKGSVYFIDKDKLLGLVELYWG